MTRLRHSVRKQSLSLTAETQAQLLALQPRLADINRRRLLPVIERVLEDMAVAGRQIRIDRLSVDLGTLPVDGFEEAVPRRLDRELRRSLRGALDRLRETPATPQGRRRDEPSKEDTNAEGWRSEAQAQLDLLAHYLLRGTLPFWAPRRQELSLEDLFGHLAATDSDGLVEAVRRYGPRARALERLVAQLDEPSLERLAELLEPRHSKLVIAYLDDIRRAHRVEPVVALGDGELGRLLWLLTQTYLLRQPGSQFNRKSFVRSLLRGLARGRGLGYLDILRILLRGLELLERKRPPGSSLPAVVRELTLEAEGEPGHAVNGGTGAAADDGGADDALLFERILARDGPTAQGTLSTENPSVRDLVEALAVNAPRRLAASVRRHGRRGRTLERLVHLLDESSLQALAKTLDPQHGELVVAYVGDIRRVHRREPTIALGDGDLGRVLWLLAQTYLAYQPGSQFNRRSFVRSLLQGLADGRGLRYLDVLMTLHRGLERLEGHLGLRSSLPAVVRDLVREAGPEAPGARPEDGIEPETPTAGAPTIDTFERFLTHGPPRAEGPGGPPPELDVLLLRLADDDPRALAAMIRRRGRDPRSLERLIEHLGEPALQRLAGVLDPRHGDLIVSYVDDIQRVHRDEPIVALPEDDLGHLLWLLSHTYLAQQPGSEFNRKSFVKSLLRGLADDSGVGYLDVLETLHSGLRRLERRRPLGSSLPAVVRDLVREAAPRSRKSGAPTPSDPSSTAPPERYLQADVLAAYLRDGALSWEAVLHDPALTPEIALAALPDLPPALLRHLLTSSPAEGRGAVLLRVAQGLPEVRLLELLRRLLPGPDEASAALRSALPPFAARASDRPSFFAAVLSAILDGRALDLEALASAGQPLSEDPAPTPAPELGDDPADWPVHALGAALVEQLRSAEAEGPPASLLLDTLLDRHPDEARRILRVAGAKPELRRSLAELTSDRLGDTLAILCPAAAETLEALSLALAEVPVPYRPSRSRVGPSLLALGVAVGGHGVLSPGVLVRLLSELFPMPLPDPVAQALRRRTKGWRGQLPDSDLDALDTAVRSSARGLPEPEPDKAEDGAGPSEEDRRAVMDLLAGRDSEGSTGAGQEGASFGQAALAVLDRPTEEILDLVRRHGADPRMRRRWSRTLPEAALARLTHLLGARRPRRLLDAAELLASAWLDSAPTGHPKLVGRSRFWSFLLGFLAEHGRSDRLLERLVVAYFGSCAADHLATAKGSADGAAVGALLLDHARRLARAAGHGPMLNLLERNRPRLLAPWQPKAGSVLRPRTERRPIAAVERRPNGGRTAFGLVGESEDLGDPIYIDNAGLVLAGPFLPQLLRMLDILDQDEDGKVILRDPEAAARAVHLLQYLVDGSTSTPEPQLVLNKLLCGLPTDAVVDRSIDATDEEIEVCDQLLASMIANWGVIQNTSVSGLRETFLKREGRLQRSADGWKLKVQRKTLDVLVDQLPWSLSVILHRWMPEPISVTW
ncbi:MAG: contractile injection system tape measure protein [Acidobacteriota bacterium]